MKIQDSLIGVGHVACDRDGADHRLIRGRLVDAAVVIDTGEQPANMARRGDRDQGPARGRQHADPGVIEAGVASRRDQSESLRLDAWKRRCPELEILERILIGCKRVKDAKAIAQLLAVGDYFLLHGDLVGRIQERCDVWDRDNVDNRDGRTGIDRSHERSESVGQPSCLRGKIGDHLGGTRLDETVDHLSSGRGIERDCLV